MKAIEAWRVPRRFNWREALCVYLAAAVLTFGVAASDRRRVCYDKLSVEQSGWCPSSQHVQAGFAAGLFWPLYWSWTAVETLRPHPEKHP